MTITEMLGQSGLLTLLGMCVVFGFIIILILCMKMLHGVLHLFKLDKDEPVAQPVTTAAAPKDDGAIVAAIAAAIKMKENK